MKLATSLSLLRFQDIIKMIQKEPAELIEMRNACKLQELEVAKSKLKIQTMEFKLRLARNEEDLININKLIEEQRGKING